MSENELFEIPLIPNFPLLLRYLNRLQITCFAGIGAMGFAHQTCPTPVALPMAHLLRLFPTAAFNVTNHCSL